MTLLLAPVCPVQLRGCIRPLRRNEFGSNWTFLTWSNTSSSICLRLYAPVEVQTWPQTSLSQTTHFGFQISVWSAAWFCQNVHPYWITHDASTRAQKSVRNWRLHAVPTLELTVKQLPLSLNFAGNGIWWHRNNYCKIDNCTKTSWPLSSADSFHTLRTVNLCICHVMSWKTGIFLLVERVSAPLVLFSQWI